MTKKKKIIPYYQLSSLERDLVDAKLSNGEKKFTTSFRNKKVTSIFLDTEEFVILVPLIISDDLTIDDVDFDRNSFI